MDYIYVYSDQETYIDHKCLMGWQAGLDPTQQHNISYSSESTRVLLESFEVLRVEGGTRYEGLVPSTKGLPLSRTSSPTTINTVAIIGGVVGGIVLLAAVVRVIIVGRRRQQQKEKVLEAAHGHVPTYAPAPIRPPSPAPPTPPTPPPAYSPPAPGPYPEPYPVTTPEAPIQQPHDDRTAGEVNRLHQVDATMTTCNEQQQHRRNDPIHEDMLPHQLTA